MNNIQITKPESIHPSLSETAAYICQSRYGTKDPNKEELESVSDIFWRVALNIAKGDERFGTSPEEIKKNTYDFFESMSNQKFLPNTPCLINAGKRHQQLSACFVLPIEDTMESILKTMSNMALIHKSGGGTGFSFSKLRPYGDYIGSSSGTTVGPVSFMQAYNDVTSQIKQGGVRRGANMGMLSIHHPDVLRFSVIKLDEYSLTNFNISLAVTNKFVNQISLDRAYVKDTKFPEEIIEKIRKAEANRDLDAKLREVEEWTLKLYDWAKATEPDEGYDLINPRNGEIVQKLNAAKVFDLVTRLAWQFGDPGLVFIDRMNEPSSNPVPLIGRIEATNPCGEQPLLPYDACNLGSINISKFVTNDKKDISWEELKKTVRLAVHFLDNVVEINEFPISEIREMVSNTRRIGLGIMGFADTLFSLGVKYDSDEGLLWARKIMKFISDASKEYSQELAIQRGVFPYWDKSVYANTEYKPRNMALTTIAPTGTISIVADCSSGIEPVFSLGYQRNTIEGKKLFILNPVFAQKLKDLNLYNEDLISKIVENGGKLSGIENIPQELKNIFITALEISPEWHIRIQAAFQEYTDNAVSKTINFPKIASVDDVRKAYLLSYSLGTKGITIYRSGSREKEVLQQIKSETSNVGEKQLVHHKKPTPQMAKGIRIRKPCDVGKVYTSVFFEDGDGPVEMFVNLGKSGGYLAGAAEVTGRLASLSLKYGATLDEIAKELVGISCGQKTGMGKDVILSMFDAVGKSLLELNQKHSLTDQATKKTDNSAELSKTLSTFDLNPEAKFDACPECKSELYAEEGCYKCSNPFCGYSKCS